jgi:hypothetical protein
MGLIHYFSGFNKKMRNNFEKEVIKGINKFFFCHYDLIMSLFHNGVLSVKNLGNFHFYCLRSV